MGGWVPESPPREELLIININCLLLLAAAAAVGLVMSDSVRPHRQKATRIPTLGFSSQEHWSGLPFPSPVRESEK